MPSQLMDADEMKAGGFKLVRQKIQFDAALATLVVGRLSLIYLNIASIYLVA